MQRARLLPHENDQMMRCCSIALCAGVSILSLACSEVTTPVFPSPISIVSTSAEVTASWAPMTYTMPVIEMLSDYTVRPSYIQVKAGYRVKVVNNSGRHF